MRKFVIAAVLATTALTAMAGDRQQQDAARSRGHHHHNHSWVAPLIGGILIGGVIANSQATPVYVPAPVYVPPQPPVMTPPIVVSPPVVIAPVEIEPARPAAVYDIQQYDGRVYRRYEQFDSSCGCVRTWDVRVR